ncbi:MAG: peptidoglycan editing factor PgeF [Betaproteobacteria bacterium]|nr:peptidoglycan editing factor PgeF [Betaproteobacteria bacterium]
MIPELILPDWPAPPSVRALASTRALGDMGTAEGRARLRAHLPAEPVWLRQVHGIGVVDASRALPGSAADASCTCDKGVVCAVMIADCMPVLLADDAGSVVAIAHAGWRGLAAGVLEAAIAATAVPAERLLAWLGPAIGAAAYEVGEEVRAEFLRGDTRAQAAFAPGRAGHWQLDLYAAARQRLAARGVARIAGGGFCTHTDQERFFSWRRDRAVQRMAAAIWLA